MLKFPYKFIWLSFFIMVMLSYAICNVKSLSLSTFGLKSVRRFMNKGLAMSTSVSAGAKISNKFTIPLINHPAYKVLEATYIEEYGLHAILYSHEKTGAEIISVLAPQDDNKVFGISFRTPPYDSTGLPHILEHSVLCGSKKYPVKEPFVDLLKGSLQNFLNAFTYPDRTCYPVASTNTKDFYNLVNVYLDAVLNPRAVNDPKVLQQEGWHYEIDGDEQLSIKGVVYNEMKGVYSSPDSILGRATQQFLFPDNTYGVDSGGDPDAIPTLTYDKFKEFHSSFYHPSNSRVFFYGNDDPMKRLELLDEYLREFSKKDISSKIHSQKRFSSPKEVKVSFPVDANTKELKHMISLNWVMNHENLSMKDQLAIGVLDSLLIGTPTSSLRKELTQSNLGESLIGGGLSDELLQATYSIGLKGVLPQNVKKVEELILNTLTKISKDGFEQDAVEAALNTMEFRLREFNTGGFPRGLSLMLSMLPNWIYEKNPFDGIRFEEALHDLKQDLKNNVPIFQELLKKYLVNNSHRLLAEAVPDKELEIKQEQIEKERLQKIKATLNQQDIESIKSAAEVLRELQLKEDSVEAKATIPRLSLHDIERQHTELPIQIQLIENNKVISHDIQSNGILYSEVAIDLSDISFEDIPYIPLFLRMLTDAGTQKYDEVTLSRKIGSNTGGISPSLYTDVKSSEYASTGDDAIMYLIMRGKSVEEKIPVMYDLITDMLLNSRFDNQRRAIEILRESKARKESSVITSGHSFAATRLSARYSLLGYMNELMSGITSVRQASNLLKEAESNWSNIQSHLENIRNSIMKRKNVIINLTASQSIIDNAMPTVKNFLTVFPETTDSAQTKMITVQQEWKANKNKYLLPMKNEGFSVPSQVNYVVKGGQLIEPNEKIPSSFSVITRFLSNSYLWDNVRVVGGAYGGFAQFSEASGRLTFLSYRDPNLAKTLETYDNSAVAMKSHEMSMDTLVESIIGTIGDMDSPKSPDQKGYTSFLEYLTGETSQDRQRHRDQILNTNLEDVQFYIQKLENMLKTANIVTVGSQSALESANKELTNPLLIESVLANMVESSDMSMDEE